MYVPGGGFENNPSKRGATDSLLRLRGHGNRQLNAFVYGLLNDSVISSGYVVKDGWYSNPRKTIVCVCV